MKKVLLFTHTDLDGVGCSLVLHQYCEINNYELDTHYCAAASTDNYISKMLYSGELERYDEVYITDLSISSALNEMMLLQKVNLCIIDHHKSADELNQYSNCYIREIYDGSPTSGTELCAIKLLGYNRNDISQSSSMMTRYIRAINDYDSWLWVTNPNKDNEESLLLNLLLSVLDPSELCSILYDHSKIKSDSLIPDEYRFVMETLTKSIDSYITNAVSKCTVYPHDGYQVGVIFADQHPALIGKKAREVYPELDYFMIVGPTYVSLKSGKSRVDLSAIAKDHGGGGHVDSAGYKIQSDTRKEYVNSIMNTKE